MEENLQSLSCVVFVVVRASHHLGLSRLKKEISNCNIYFYLIIYGIIDIFIRNKFNKFYRQMHEAMKIKFN